jgi:hypothetical protein
VTGKIEAAIRARLAGGEGMVKVSKTLGVGVSTVVRVRREMKQAEEGDEQPLAGGSGGRRHERAA